MPEKNTITHRLVLVTRKKKWEEVTGKKWMVAVLPVSKWKEIQSKRKICTSDAHWCKDSLLVAFPKSNRQFRRMVLNGEIREASSAVEAYKEAYSWVAELEASKHTANVHCDGIDCHVYAMRMKPTAWKMGKFAAKNAHILESARLSTSCFYVGQTGRHHFLRPFAMAHDDEVRELIAAYASDVGVPMSELPYGRSILHEAGFAKWLQERGKAVIFG